MPASADEKTTKSYSVQLNKLAARVLRSTSRDCVHPPLHLAHQEASGDQGGMATCPFQAWLSSK